MANPDQKTILLEQAYDEIKVICTKFQDESGATDMEVKTLLRELARVWEKDIDEDYDIDWEVWKTSKNSGLFSNPATFPNWFTTSLMNTPIGDHHCINND